MKTSNLLKLGSALWLGALCFAGQNAKATLALQDPFNYTVGNLAAPGVASGNIPPVDAKSGAMWSNGVPTSTENIQVVSGNLTYGGLYTPSTQGNMVSLQNNGSGSASIQETSSGANTTRYYSFLLNMSTLPPATGEVIAFDGGSASSVNGLSSTIGFDVYAASNSPTTYTLGIRVGSSNIVYTSGIYPLNSTNLVVVKYNNPTSPLTNVSDILWVNPSSATFGGAADPANPASTVSITNNAVWKYFTFLNSANNGAGACYVDNLRIGTAYADVTPSSNAPAAPTLAGTTAPGSSGFTINWSDTGATGYRVDVATDAGFVNVLAGYSDLDVGSATSLALSGLTANTTYYYQVRAYNSTGISASTGTNCILLSGPPASAPTAMTGSCQPVTVTWSAVANATGYNIYRSSGGSYTVVGTVGAPTNTFYDDNAPVGSSYTYEVSALNGPFETTLSSPSSPVTPTGAPDAPAQPTVATGCSLTVNWSSVGGATGGYNIYRKYSGDVSYGASLGHVASGTLTYLDSTATNSTKSYVYAVTAVGSCESAFSPDSAAASPTDTQITSQPANVMTAPGYAATFTVAANNASSYLWQVSTDHGGTWSSLGVTTASYTTGTTTTNMNGYQYECVIDGTCDNVTSAAATLNVGAYFKSLATGNWSTNTTWQISTNGSTGWAPAPSGVIPLAITPVEIATNTIVTMDNTNINANNAASLTIDNGGGLANPPATAGQATLALYGNLAANNGPNSFTNTGSTAHAIVLDFVSGSPNSGYDTWTGSGDVSGSKIDLTVDSGVTLDISGLTAGIKSISGSGTTKYLIEGTLITGQQVIDNNGGVNLEFTLTNGATLVTANVNGLVNSSYIFAGGTNPASCTFDFSSGDGPNLSTAANYVFNGTAAQATIGLPSTVNNLVISNAAGVTLSSDVAVTGQLQINSGTLNPQDDNSTAGTLSFNGGATEQLAGTWGPAGTHQAAQIVGSGYVTIASGPKLFKSNGTGGGNWSANATWQESTDGSTYTHPSTDLPDSNSSKIEILAGDAVTNDVSGQSMANAVIDANGDLTVNPGVTVTLVNGAASLSLTNNGTFFNEGTVTWASWALNAGATYIHYNTQAPGTGAYDNCVYLDPASTWIFEGSATVATPLATSDRTYGNLILESADGSAYTTSAGAAGTLTVQGDFTLGANVTVTNTQTGPWVFEGNFTDNGTITNEGAEICNFSGSGTTIGGAANPIPFVTWNINSGASVTLAENVSASGTLTVNPAAALDFGGHTVTVAGTPSLAGTLTMEVTKTAPDTFTGAQLVDSAGAIPYGGTLTVTESGQALGSGDSITLFSPNGGSGNFSATNLPALGAGLAWVTTNLASGGSIQVVLSSVPPYKIQSVYRDGLGNLVIPVATMAGHTYNLQSATNMTSPVWITIKTIAGNGATTNAAVPLSTTTIPKQFFRYQAE